ncbi:MAG: ATP phosphoribosyltransferase regulatory subunit [Firmicutes bacterium]|nr:ATP phosphoribosyltransferase regulatory subunit [Bacillota bacterium]
MKRYARITPEGTRDMLFEDCVAMHTVEDKLTALFSGLGYHEVQTPGLEFYDVLRSGNAGFPVENMFKLTDSKGRLMVLRPDSTMPIARMTSTRLQNAALPIRLYYNQKVYRCNPSFSGHSNEVMQVGVELIGASGKRSDLEVVATAAYALAACMDDFRIELGHAGFFRAIASRMNLDEETCEDIRSFIEAKNYAALDALLDTLPDSVASRAMRRLPRLFGGEEVLEEAEALCGGVVPAESLDYLRMLYQELLALGIGDRLMIDLGLVNRNDYYTGIVFRGYLPGSGDTILSGGRYDGLLAKFGTPMPAIGFGVDVEAVTRLLLREGKVQPQQPVQVLVHGMDGCEIRALRRVRELLQSGVTCEASTCATADQALAYARRAGIRQVELVGETIEQRRILEDTGTGKGE